MAPLSSVNDLYKLYFVQCSTFTLRALFWLRRNETKVDKNERDDDGAAGVAAAFATRSLSQRRSFTCRASGPRTRTAAASLRGRTTPSSRPRGEQVGGGDAQEGARRPLLGQLAAGGTRRRSRAAPHDTVEAHGEAPQGALWVVSRTGHGAKAPNNKPPPRCSCSPRRAPR